MKRVSQETFEYVFRPGKPPGKMADAGHGYRVSREDGMLIERDVTVPMRDGIRIFVDIFRPDGAAHGAPTLIAWGPYGKHSPRGTYARFHDNGGVKHEWVSRHAAFEAPDPLYWTRHGYAVINVDPRGTWQSEGKATFWSGDEAKDYYDLIEWVAVQPWSNGRVGCSGVSYLAIMQWHVAALRPPHLAAINPWEGYSDSYRDRVRHGGIPENLFMPSWLERSIYSSTEVEDVMALIDLHPFYDAYWKSKAPELSRIEVPAYVVASWGDQGLHTRGTVEGFKQMSSKHKWLEVHGRNKWETYLRPDMVEKQRVFFDSFLKGTGDAVLGWPRVNIEVRERHYIGEMRAEIEFPLARTRYTKLFLDGAARGLTASPASASGGAETSDVEYDASAGRAVFDHRFAEATELTGHMKLRLWVATSEGDDMDLFIAIHKLDAAGEQVPFAFFAVYDDGPVALGWLRVSHRELDPARSTEHQPWLLHQRELRLKPGEFVPVDIEILVSSTLFRKDESLRLVIQGRDFYTLTPKGPMIAHGPLRNIGKHIVRSGGRYDSHLLVPAVPKAS